MAVFAAFGELVRDVVGVANPQEKVGPSRRGESDLMDWVCAWLRERGIEHEADPYWGLHAVLTGPEGPGERPGMLLGAHLDSDHLNVGDLHSLSLDLASERILCPGEVGLDCKTGVAIALSVLERLRSGCAAMPGEWQVHILFTTGEESGQKGAIRADLDLLLAGRVRHAVVIDRMTRGACAPEDGQGRAQRHAVTNYHDVELLDAKVGNELRGHLARGRARALGNGAKVVPLPEALDAYNKATVELRRMMDAARPEQRVSSMFSPPRSARYELMAAVSKLALLLAHRARLHRAHRAGSGGELLLGWAGAGACPGSEDLHGALCHLTARRSGAAGRGAAVGSEQAVTGGGRLQAVAGRLVTAKQSCAGRVYP